MKKIAFITGSTSGIGYSISKVLAKDYALSRGALRVTLVGEIPQKTGKTIIEALDVDGLKGLLSLAR